MNLDFRASSLSSMTSGFTGRSSQMPLSQWSFGRQDENFGSGITTRLRSSSYMTGTKDQRPRGIGIPISTGSIQEPDKRGNQRSQREGIPITHQLDNQLNRSLGRPHSSLPTYVSQWPERGRVTGICHGRALTGRLCCGILSRRSWFTSPSTRRTRRQRRHSVLPSTSSP